MSWRRRASELRFRRLRDRHAGQRCFIIGNGPSLQRTDLARLRTECTFGLNRVYLLFPKLGFHTTYYAAVNRLVIEQCAREIQALPMPKFVSWYGRHDLKVGDDTYWLRDVPDGTLRFARQPYRRIWESATVTYTALQLAFFMGFTQVILVGVDHYFSTPGQPHAMVTSGGPDPNHFDPNYFGQGFRWNLPDLEASEFAYRLARQHFEHAGREVLDATVDGKLTVFPKIEFGALF